MKKSTIRRLLVLCLCLTLVSVSLIGGTLAKYTNTVTGTGTVNIASWSFTAAGEATSFSFKLEGSGTGGKLVPGDSGTFTIKLKAGADVPVKWTASIKEGGNVTNFPVQLSATSGTLDAGAEGSVNLTWTYTNTTEAQEPVSLSQIVVEIIGEQNTTATTQNVTLPTTAAETP